MTLFEAAADLLAAVQAQYEEQAPEPPVLPSRRYVANGAIARGCDQLVVAPVRTYAGTPAALATGPTQPLAQRTVVLRVEVCRCVPTVSEAGTPPAAEAITASAEALAADHDGLVAGARRFANEWGGGCSEVVIGDATPFGPEGGMGGWGLEVRVQLG